MTGKVKAGTDTKDGATGVKADTDTKDDVDPGESAAEGNPNDVDEGASSGDAEGK